MYLKLLSIPLVLLVAITSSSHLSTSDSITPRTLACCDKAGAGTYTTTIKFDEKLGNGYCQVYFKNYWYCNNCHALKREGPAYGHFTHVTGGMGCDYFPDGN